MATKTRTASATGSSGSGYGALQRMNDDWQVLGRDPRAARHIVRWAQEDIEFADVRTPQDVVSRLASLFRRGDWAGHDLALTALLRRASGDDFDGQLAWRIAVRILMPKAILLAKSQMRDGVEWDVVFSTVLSALFEVVRTYPLDRRPRRIFVNLSMDTLMLAQKTLADDYDDRRELRKIARSLEPLAGDPQVALLQTETPDPYLQVELADLLARAAELELVSHDEPELSEGESRTDLIALIIWAVEIKALKVSEARQITQYYLSSSLDPDQPIRTTRAMGADGARLRQRASRAVRPLRHADLGAYLAAAA
ncbi:hypothetical protein [Streptomyces sp. RKAG337]|uniref:hypothetical protein n=1 Tax=Streptomyces sp. RKAG337 TaxID=2893404 RepID=UPI00203419A6|nr:hypothetical protein [Streptomyces sp. RKAG337]MCM2430882.1 hypothetical protein [Streptomyces sp. RKAG337]